LPLFFGCTITSLASSAFADAPPPTGQKFVGYSFTVTGLAAAPEQVLLAYPCGPSQGSPTAAYANVEEGKAVSVGRRGGLCTMYTKSKASHDEFLKTYKPTNETTDPALAEFMKDAVKCDGGPAPSFVLPSTDSRDVISETFAVKTLTSSSCSITNTTPSPTPKPTTTPVAPTVPTTEASAATDAGPSNAPASSSSSSCTQGPGATRSLGVAVAAGLLGIALLGRRRRR
jgi:hypothetical protein